MIDRRVIKSHVDRHLRTARSNMPPRVQRAYDQLIDQHRLLASDLGPYFGVLGHPLFELPVWVAQRLRAAGVDTPEEQLADILGISALGYFHIRAQDDWLDAASPDDRTLVALAEALLATCNRLLVSTVGTSDRFWRLHDEIFNSYAESLLFTDELRRTGARISDNIFERLLAQSRPLVIPSAALLDIADHWHLLPGLEEFVFAASAASQLFNDLTDLYRDQSMGQRTWAIETIGKSDTNQLWLDALGMIGETDGGRFQRIITKSLEFHDRSAQAARDLSLTAAETWLAERRATLASLFGPLQSHLLTSFLQRISEPESTH